MFEYNEMANVAAIFPYNGTAVALVVVVKMKFTLRWETGTAPGLIVPNTSLSNSFHQMNHFSTFAE